VHPCSTTGYRPHPYAPVNSHDWPVWRHRVHLAIVSQLNTSWDPSVTFYACSSWLSESATVVKSDEAAFETMFHSITSPAVRRGNLAVDRRVVELSSSGRRCHPLDVQPWTAGLSVCPRWDAAVSLRHLVTSSRVAAAILLPRPLQLCQLLFSFGFLSFP